MDVEIKEYLDNKFELINDRFKIISDIKKTVDTIAEKIPPLSERITGCEKDFQYINQDFCCHKEETEREFDKVWNKNREQDKILSSCNIECKKEINEINKKIYYIAGGVAVAAFLISMAVKLL